MWELGMWQDIAGAYGNMQRDRQLQKALRQMQFYTSELSASGLTNLQTQLAMDRLMMLLKPPVYANGQPVPRVERCATIVACAYCRRERANRLRRCEGCGAQEVM